MSVPLWHSFRSASYLGFGVKLLEALCFSMKLIEQKAQRRAALARFPDVLGS